MDLRFGILTLASGPISHISRDWRTAEELGFDSAWVADTLSLSGLVEYEAWTILAALAEKTSRLRIGTLVTQITFRHPAILATQAITLDHISGGRLEVGLGAGDYVADGAAVGMEPWPIMNGSPASKNSSQSSTHFSEVSRLNTAAVFTVRGRCS